MRPAKSAPTRIEAKVLARCQMVLETRALWPRVWRSFQIFFGGGEGFSLIFELPWHPRTQNRLSAVFYTTSFLGGPWDHSITSNG